MKRLNILVLLLLITGLSKTPLHAKTHNTGAQDRAIWVQHLWKISYPVIHNLAEGTLVKNMPVETPSGNQNFDNNGWLVLGFNGSQPEMADGYTSTGSLYMASLSFLPLGLPADNKFWTDPAADWTTKKAWKGDSVKKDYKVEY